MEFHFTDILLTSWLTLQRHTVSKQTAIVPPLKPKGLFEEETSSETCKLDSFFLEVIILKKQQQQKTIITGYIRCSLSDFIREQIR